MAQPSQIERPKQLLVEGNDQRNFFEALIRHLSLSDIQLQDYGGGDELRVFLPAFVKAPSFDSITSLGIVRDAEESAQSAFQSVQGSLGKVNLPVPANAEKRQSGKPDISVLILPDNNSTGMLESLLCRTFKGSEVDRCIDDFFTCAKSSPNTSITNPDKARAFAFLTTKPNPHHSVGIAAHQGVWNLNHEAFDGVRDFLQAL